MTKRRKKSRGVTLLEVVIAISIFLIGLEGVTILFAKTWKNNSYILEMGQSSIAASQGVNKMVEHIRGTRQADDGSYPVKSADDNDLVVFSDHDDDGITERLHFYYSDGAVYMGTRNPTAGLPKTYPSGDEEVRTVAVSVVNEASEPVFQYYNQDYPEDQVNNPLSTPATVADVRLVEIHLKINVDPARDPDDIEMKSFVELRNLNDYDRIQ